MNCSHVCALGGIFTYPWLWGSCKAVRISLSVSLPFVLSQAPSSLCHPTVSLSLFYIHEGTGVCTDTSRRIVLDVARTFADWRLVEITRSKPTVFLSLSLSLSLNYSKSNLQASVRNECKNELDVMSDWPAEDRCEKRDTMRRASGPRENPGRVVVLPTSF